MKNIIIYLSFIMISNIYAQCDDYSENQCSNDNNCEWVVTYQWYDCDNFSNSSQCNYYSEYGCYWDSHWYYSGWSDCDGPSFQLETGGFCQELEMQECNEEYEFQCTDGSCIPIHRVCNNFNDCEDGSDEIDCENCSELLESDCSDDDSCEWIDNPIETGSCSALSLSVCDLPEYGPCYSYCTNWGYYYNCTGETICIGGQYEVDTSYCEEMQYQLGDINLDGFINVIDVVESVELIISSQYNNSGDLNQDGVLNVSDVIILINIILNN